MKDATLTQVLNNRVSTAEPQNAVKTSPRATVSMHCEDKIRELAYQKWEVAGQPENDGVDFWLEAERELTLQTFPDAGPNIAK